MFGQLFSGSSRGRLGVFLSCLVITGMIATACGGAPTDSTSVPEPEFPEPTEPPAVEEARLAAWFAGNEQDYAFLQDQIAAFQAEYPQISLELNFVPFDTFMDALATALAAGVPPDIATVVLNNVVDLQNIDALSALNMDAIDLVGDFRSDALSSGQIGGTQYGLALRQFGCAPAYQYLVQFKATQYPQQGMLFIDYLTRQDRQRDAYAAAQWIPTRQSVYDEMGVSCQPLTPIRLSPAEILTAISIVTEQAPELAPVLGGVQLNPYEAVTILEDGVLQGTFSARTTPLSDVEMQQMTEGDGAVVGGMFIENAPEYLPGAYVLKCKAGGDCFFLNADGSDSGYRPEAFTPLELPVEKFVVVAVEGSKKVTVYVPLVGWVTIRIG